ncbi:MAG: type II secretion system F family protein [Pirellulales bacterium]|nr:type II secretion system F family protein [Pirellulales bacterium]
MSIPQPKPREATLAELGLLCDEIAALSRAGVPLEGGLAGLASDLPGRMGRFAGKVAEQLKTGKSLPDAIAATGTEMPSYFRAVIEAGLRSGRLSAALEGVAGSLRRLADLRRGVGAALVYPLVVMLLAYATLVFLAVYILPMFLLTNRSFDIQGPWFVAALVRLGQTPQWVLLPPAVMLAGFGLWWWSTGRAIVDESRWTRGALYFWPGLRRVQRDSRTAVEADILALLIENDVPLADAIELAGDAAGDPRTRLADAKIAASLRRGESLASASVEAADSAPVVRWMLLGDRRETIVAALRHAAAGYRRRAAYRAELVRIWFPFAVTLFVGGGTVLAVGLALFVPFAHFMQGLAQ